MEDFTYSSLAFKSRLNLIKDIRTVLSFDDAKQLAFRHTPFGPWLDLAMTGHDPMLLNMFLQKEVSAKNAEPNQLYFDVYGHSLCFGRREFCLITGLRFGPTPSLPSASTESFVRRVFIDEEPETLQNSTVYERMMLNNMSDLRQEDVIRVCLVVMVELVFMGREQKQVVSQTVLRAVEDLQVFCNYPWGEHIWSHTFKQMHMAYSRRLERNGSLSWTMSGFTYAFKIWILEMFPVAAHHFNKQDHKFPRGVSWTRATTTKTLSNSICLQLFQSVGGRLGPLSRLTSTSTEEQMGWYIESCPYFLHNSRDQYQDKWDDLAELRITTESNTRRINEMEELVRSLGAYQMSDVPAPTTYFNQFEVENSYFDQFEIPRRSYEMPSASYGMATSSYEMARSSCVIRPTYMQDFGTSGYVPHMTSCSGFDTAMQSSSSFQGTTITHHSHYSSPVSSPCGVRINEEHFSTPESESEAPMDESEDKQQEVPAPRPGFRERWRSKVTLTPWGKQRATKPVAGKKTAQTNQNSNTLPYSTNREVVTGLMIYDRVQNDDIPELCLPFIPHIPVDKDFWKVLLGLDGIGNLQEEHIDNWAYKLVATRSNTARWTIMNSQFSGFMMQKKGGEESVVAMCDGTQPHERPWHATDTVYIPICIVDNQHWVLGVLDLPTMEMVVYDTLRSFSSLQRTMVEVMKIFADRVKKLLKKIKYRCSKSFSWKYDECTSQQSGRYGDCGVWVCKNMESLVAGEVIPTYAPDEAAEAAMQFRLKMAEVFYAHAFVRSRNV